MMGRLARRLLRTVVRALPPERSTQWLARLERHRGGAPATRDPRSASAPTRTTATTDAAASAARADATGSARRDHGGADLGCAVVLAPDALVTPYRRSLAEAAAVAAEEGLRVVALRCRGALGACISKRFSGVEPSAMRGDVDAVCAQCALAGAVDPLPSGCEARWIDDLVEVEQARQDDDAAAGLSSDALATLEVDGLPVGAICASELLHNLRVLRYDPRDPGHESAMRSKVRAAVRSLRAFQRLAATERVSVLIHFSDYSYHLVPAMAARRAGMRVVNLTHPAMFNVSPVRSIALPRTTLEHCYEMVRAWPRFAQRPLPPERVELMTRDQLFRMTGGGSHIFSPVRGDAPQALRQRLRIDRGRPVVVAFTSSPDELNSIELWSSAVGIDLGAFPDPFDTQVDWLDATAAHLASQESSPLLVVRIHPREGSRGGREAQSEHLRLLRSHLEGRADVRVIWPDDAFSSYDLGEIATCVTTSWSSLGQEFARAGAEVVRAFGMKVPIPLGVFSRYAPTKEGYAEALRAALTAAPSLDAVRLALRWHNLEYLGSALDPATRGMPRSDAAWPGRRALADLTVNGREVMEASLEMLPHAADAGAEEAERRAIEKGLRRLLAVLMGEPAPEAASMHLDAPAPECPPSLMQYEPVIGADDAVTWQVAGRTLGRQTVLARRVAQLVHQAARAAEDSAPRATAPSALTRPR